MLDKNGPNQISAPNLSLNSNRAGIASRSFFTFRYLDSAQRLGAGVAG
jgi:hypothetical protein